MKQLIDISALASCFKEYGPHPLHYLYRLLMPAESTAYNLLGNTVNTMFDAVVSQPQKPAQEQWSEILQQSWHNDALLFLNTDDDTLNRRYFQVIGEQYQHVRQVVETEFPAQGIDASQAWLEPSFVCPELGLSGRMDLLYIRSEKAGERSEKASIVELKSGKMNEWQHQAKQAHRVQTMLYAEVLNRCLGIDKAKISNYLHYNTYPLLQAQTFPEELLEVALDLRRQIADMLHEVATDGGRRFFTREAVEQMYPEQNGKLWTTHEKPRLLEFVSSIEEAPAEVRDWFFSRLQFILREEELKELQPEPVSLRQLPLLESLTNGEGEVTGLSLQLPTGQSSSTQQQSSLPGLEHDFRTGDPVLLYPLSSTDTQASDSIILRGSIAQIDDAHIAVTLRHAERACHIDELRGLPLALEHDVVNSSISQACRSLYQTLLNGGPSLTNCRLIVGPPGTGKTSVTLKNIVQEKLLNTEERVLLIAFTHRAVDEICETLENVFLEVGQTDESSHPTYIRLGTSNDTPTCFHPHLLQNHIDHCADRNALRQLISRTRFWVGTTARLQATSQLFELMQFDTIIADEASQLLDFQVINLLQEARKESILIGDPKQLPAVTLQTGAQSLFEELYRTGTPSTLLSRQGRMHPDIAQFANRMFYGSQLQAVGLPHQQEAQALMPRFWFFDVPSPALGTKANPAEARKVAQIVKRVQEIYQEQHWPWTEKTLGIIVPYRQQIAAIRRELDALATSKPHNLITSKPHSLITSQPQNLITSQPQNLITTINIDTVERYQGSQRDVIIYTTTVSTPEQLAQLSAPIELDEQLIDRKLNVALTRARKHLFIVGNRQLLSQSPVYQELLTLMADKMATPQ